MSIRYYVNSVEHTFDPEVNHNVVSKQFLIMIAFPEVEIYENMDEGQLDLYEVIYLEVNEEIKHEVELENDKHFQVTRR